MENVPVDISFIIGGDYKDKLNDVKAGIAGVDSASDAATDAMRQQLEAAAAAAAKMKRELDEVTAASGKTKMQLDEASAAVRQMEKDIADMEKKLSNTGSGKDWLAVRSEIDAAKKALEEEKVLIHAQKQALEEKNAVISSTKKALEEQKDITAELERRIKEATKSTVSFRAEQLRLVEELRRMRQAGLENTEAYGELAQKLGEMSTIMRTTTAEVKQLGTVGDVAAGLASGISGVAGVMSAAAGGMGVFNAKNEEFEKIQTRIQSLMAITVGMQEAATMLHQTSAFRINIVTKAKKAWAAAVKYLNVQLGIANGLSKALVAGGIGLLIVGVGLLVRHLQKLKEERAELMEQQDEEVSRRRLSFTLSMQESGEVAKQVAKVDVLRSALKNANTAYEDKIKAINRLKSIIPGYNAELDASGNLIKENTKSVEEYISALHKKARTIAAEGKLAEQYKKIYDADFEIYELEKAYKAPTTAFDSTPLDEATRAEIQEKMGGIAANVNKQTIDALKSQKEKIKQDIVAIQKVINDNSDALLFGDTATDAMAASELKTESELQKLLREINARTEKLKLELQEDGLKKRLAALDLEKAQELAKIAERNKAIVDAYNKKHPKAKVKSIADIDPKAAEEQQAATTAMEEGYKDKAQKTIDDYVKAYQSYTDRRFEIEDKFTNEIAELDEKNTAGQYDGAIVEMRKLRSSELHKLELEAGDATKTITRLFSDMSGKSVTYMEAVADEAEEMVKFLEENEVFQENDFGISEDDFLRIKQTPAELKKVTDSSKNLRKEVNDTKTGFSKFTTTLKQMNTALESGNDAAFVQALQDALGYAQSIASALDMAGDAMRAVAKATNNEKLEKFADKLKTVTSAIQGAGQGAAVGAQIGGGYGAVIGAVAGGLLSLITSMEEANAKSAQAAAEQQERIKKIQQERVLAEMELKRLADERLRVENEVNKSRLEVIDAERKILEQKQKGVESRMSEITSKLANSTYTGLESYTVRGSGRGAIYTERTREVQKSILDYLQLDTTNNSTGRTTYSGGSGDRSYQSITPSTGTSTDYNGTNYLWTQEAIDRLRALREQETSLKDADKAYIDEILEEWDAALEYADAALEKERERKELLTGTTQDGLLDGLKKGLSEGKKAFADFAGDTESILREALLSAVTASVSGEALNKLYEDLYKSIEDGSLTEEEVEKFKAGYAQIGENMGKALDALNQAGIDIAGGDTSLTGAVKTITEQSAGLMTGQLNGIRATFKEQLALIGQLLAQVQRIRTTTDAYLPFLQTISSGIDKLNSSPLNEARAA
jgi:uncharacterized protein YcfJ